MNELVAWLDKFIEADGRRVRAQCHLDEAIRLERAIQPRCGNCYWWVKSRDCPREHNVNGQTRGPSCDGMPCHKFQESSRVAELRTLALAERTAALAAFHEGERG